MRTNFKLWGLLLVLMMGQGVRGQGFAAEQLILDWQKLTQEKQILDALYDGYQILSKGYGAIRDLSEGSFNLHKAFLDGLLAVSPAVKNYRRVTDIITLQERIVGEYNTSWSLFRKDPHFTPDEVGFMSNVYSGLFDQTVKNLSDLTNLLTDGVFRASDAERLDEIDGLYKSMESSQAFMIAFNNQTALLSLQRSADINDYETVKRYYGLNS